VMPAPPVVEEVAAAMPAPPVVKQEAADMPASPAVAEATFEEKLTQVHALTEAGEFEAALHKIAEVRETLPENASQADEESAKIYQKWAESLEEQSHFEKAIEVYRKQIATGIQVEHAHEEIARAYGAWAEHEEAAGKISEAVEIYNLLLLEQPGHEAAPADILRLLRLQAKGFVDNGDYESAIASLRQAQDVRPDVGEVGVEIRQFYVDWAQAHLEAKEYEPAVLVYTQAGKHNEDFGAALSNAYILWAAHHESEGDYEQAIESLHRHKRDHGGSPEADQKIIAYYVDWGKYLREDGHHEAAQDVAQRLKNEFSDYVPEVVEEIDPNQAFRASAQEAEEKNDLEAALARVGEWLAAHPESAEAAAEKTRLSQAHIMGLLSIKKFEEASKLLGDVGSDSVTEQTTAVYTQWAKELEEQGEFKKAHEKLLQAPAQDEPAAALIVRWGESLEATGNQEAALEIFRRIPNNEAATAHVARLETALAPEPEAEVVTAPEPETFAAPVEEALAVSEPEAPDAGVEEAVVEEVPAAAPNETAAAAAPDAGVEEAIAKGQQGDIEGAESYLRERMLAEPSNKGLHAALYQVLQKGDNTRRLVEFYREVQKTAPNEPMFLLQLARAYCYTGKDTLAVVQFRKLVQSNPSADSYADLAEAYLRLKKPQDALKSIQSGLELDAANVPSLIAKAKVSSGEDNEGARAAVDAALTAPRGSEGDIHTWLQAAKTALDGGGPLPAELIEQRMIY